MVRLKRRHLSNAALVLVAGVLLFPANIYAQEAPTPTPILINLPTDTPIPNGVQGESPGLTVSQPTWTSTAVGQVFLSALDIANVRALPDTAEAQLGVIRSGDLYIVTGRYINWYQLQYQASPTGFGWVYGELVEITGDPSVIADIDPYSQPTPASNAEGSTGESDAAGGIIATATLLAGGRSAIGTDESFAPVMPTFTYPPGLVRPNATSIAANTSTAAQPTGGGGGTEDMPPIVPILVLGGLGLVGLAITSVRR